MAIQYLLPCTTEAGVVGASDFERQLDRERQISRPREVGIRTPLDAAEMARVLRNYSQRLDPQSIRACRCQHMIWVRLFTRTQPFDLVFTTLAEQAEELAQLPLTQAR